jgi:REP element-mobilizing transposase RayT
MARPLRLEFANAVYHVTSRGNRKERIFLTGRDRCVFLTKFNDTLEKFSFICYAYCLMGNHYHLLLRTPRPNLAKGMHYLNASYTNWFKVKHSLVGVVFQGRYKAILVDEEAYARTLAAYIHLNPVRAGIIDDVGRYPWSSYLNITRSRPSRLERLDPSFILSLFGAEPVAAATEFDNFVRGNAKMESPFKDVKKGCVLGSKEFVEKITARIGAGGRVREIPETRVDPFDGLKDDAIITKIAEILETEKESIFERRNNNLHRQLALYILKKHSPLMLTEIGNIFGMDYAAVHEAVKRLERVRLKDRAVEAMIFRAEELLRGQVSFFNFSGRQKLEY